MALLKQAALKDGGTELDRKIGYVRWRDVGLLTANERHSGVDVVHGCFMEGGDSILSVFSSEPLRAKL